MQASPSLKEQFILMKPRRVYGQRRGQHLALAASYRRSACGGNP